MAAKKRTWNPNKSKEEISADRQAKVDAIMEAAARKIIEIIESGQSLQWKKSWKGNPLFDAPYNAVTGHVFTGFNRFTAMLELMARETSDGRFMTYKQIADFNEANDTKCYVKKGEKAIYLLKPVVFDKNDDERPFDSSEDQEGCSNAKKRKVVFFHPYPIFHASQIEGMPQMPEPALPDWDEDLLIENLINASGAEVRHGGDRAFFRPSHDFIQLPFAADFDNKAAYYGTKLHEWYHWTGHPDREKREFGASFGDEKYAIEELRAESFSVMTGLSLGLPIELDDHAAYLKSWSGKLESKDGIKEIIRCMNEAGKMLDVVMEFKNGAKPDVDWWPEELSLSMIS